MFTDVSVLVRTILRDLSENCVTLFSPTKAASVGAEPSNTVPATIAPLIRSLLSKAPSLLRSKTPSCKQLLPPVKGQNANPKPPDEAEQALLVVGSTEFTNPIPPLIWKFRIARSPDDPTILPAAAAFRSLYHPKTEGVTDSSSVTKRFTD